MTAYLISDHNTYWIAVFNGEGEYIMDNLFGLDLPSGDLDPYDFDSDDEYYLAVLARNEFDAKAYWSNRAGACSDIEQAASIDELCEREWWNDGYHAEYFEIKEV